MTHPDPAVDSGRRETLRWAFGLSLGTALAPLAGCGGNNATEDTLPEAPVLSSKNGMLELALSVRYATQSLDIASNQGPTYPGVSKKNHDLAAQLQRPLHGADAGPECWRYAAHPP